MINPPRPGGRPPPEFFDLDFDGQQEWLVVRHLVLYRGRLVDEEVWCCAGDAVRARIDALLAALAR